jgi:hypothetical protein
MLASASGFRKAVFDRTFIFCLLFKLFVPWADVSQKPNRTDSDDESRVPSAASQISGVLPADANGSRECSIISAEEADIVAKNILAHAGNPADFPITMEM